MDLEAVNRIGGSGTLSVHMTAQVVEACRALGIDRTLIDVGGLDHNRATLSHVQPIRLPNGVYLGIRPEQTVETYGYLADKERAARQRSIRAAVDIEANTAHIERVRGLGLNNTFAIEIHSISSGHTQAFAEILEDRHERLPEEVRLGYHVLPHEEYLRESIRLEPQLTVHLKDRGLLSCSIEVDNRSAIAQRLGRSYQDRLAANALAGFMAGVWHFSNQRSPADATHALGRYAALVGLSFGVKPLLSSPAVSWWQPLQRAFGWSSRGQGSLEDVVIQTRAAAKDALTDPSWRSIDEDIHPQRQAFLVLCVPLRRSDKRWRPLVAEVELWLENEYRQITPIWVSGNGIAHPELGNTSPYWVQASLFFPLPDVPRPVQHILDNPTLLRRTTRQVDPAVSDRRPNGRLIPLDQR